MRLNDYYHDRGVVKYNGFFLSEHTAELSDEEKEMARKIKGKEQMSEEVIFEVIDFAIFKDKKISVQLNLRDMEGNFLEDIIGFIQGYDGDDIYLNDMMVPLSQIRHVTELETQIWFKEEF